MSTLPDGVPGAASAPAADARRAGERQGCRCRSRPPSTGLKGYVTNLPIETMDGAAVIAAYHDLWQVEKSFRMSKNDLRARPIFHHQRDAIEAHLTVVFAALAVSRYLQDLTGVSISKLVRTLRTVRSATVRINGAEITIDPEMPLPARDILGRLRPTGH